MCVWGGEGDGGTYTAEAAGCGTTRYILPDAVVSLKVLFLSGLLPMLLGRELEHTLTDAAVRALVVREGRLPENPLMDERGLRGEMLRGCPGGPAIVASSIHASNVGGSRPAMWVHMRRNFQNNGYFLGGRAAPW